jgi:predicted ferric reductase
MSGESLWYLSQATGLVCLVLFSAVLVLGILVGLRAALPGLPRFGTLALHRSLSLLSMAFLTVHVLTAVLDSYAGIDWYAALVPFASGYQPLWIGLGALSLDLLLAVAATSLLRRRIGHRAWRAVHWSAYASWPVAVLHGYSLGSGDGSAMTGWGLWLTVGCVLAVLGAVGLRIAAARRPRPTPATLLSALDVRTPEPPPVPFPPVPSARRSHRHDQEADYRSDRDRSDRDRAAERRVGAA